MSTRSTIWIKNADETYDGVYCHYDGYLSEVGLLLYLHYNTEEKIRALISLGSLSSLGESIDCPKEHSYQNPVKGVTVAYHRDRGEGLHIYHADSKLELKNLSERFNYIFTQGAWTYQNGRNLEEDLLDERLIENVHMEIPKF